MKFCTPILTLLAVFWGSYVESQGLPDMSEVVQQPYNRQMMEYIRDRMEEEYPDNDMDLVARPKKWWGSSRRKSKSNRWGNKYKDNKSYGFWITALNKAGNKKKRGQMGASLMPALIPIQNEDYTSYAYPGYPDYSDFQDLAPKRQH